MTDALSRLDASIALRGLTLRARWWLACRWVAFRALPIERGTLVGHRFLLYALRANGVAWTQQESLLFGRWAR